MGSAANLSHNHFDPIRPLPSKRHRIISIICLVMIWSIVGCGGSGNDKAAVNTFPRVDAGADRIVNQGETVILSGSAVNYPDGRIAGYLWEQTAGPPVILMGADTVSANFIAPQTANREVLIFRFTVQDQDGAQASDSVTLTVNAAPTASAGPGQFAYGASPVYLYGSADDSDGVIISHRWEQYAGTEVALSGVTTPTLSFVAPAQTGTLAFRYTVVDNEGAVASAAVAVHVSRILFADPFDEQTWESKWGVVDDSGSPSSWSVIAGELYQQNSVHDNTLIESYHTGTFAYLRNSAFAGSSAYRLSVDITPRINLNGNPDGHDIGIMFAYAAVDDYYRVSMNARYGFTRLEKRQGADFKTVAVNSVGYVDNDTLRLTVEVDRDTIVIMINGEPVFAESNLVISPGTVALYCQDRASFANVVIAENAPQPVVAISSPLAHSVTVAPRDGLTVSATAVVLNKPIGGHVSFSLEEGSEFASSISGNRHSASIGVTDGDHLLSAILKDADGNELHRDINDAVGIGGNYVITVGDSITNGIGDENPYNNDSLDGRMVSRQGFQARLADRLTAVSGLPQIVFNEGIPRDRAFHLDEMRIESILERHPGANKMLLLIGTNDAVSNTDPEKFWGAVRRIVDAALVNGIDQVFVASILPFFNAEPLYGVSSEELNRRVRLLNARIQEIVTAPDLSGNLFAGPDFYTLFAQHARDFYSSDGFHPNDAGYAAMADAWLDILVAHEP
jgi:lysophospholipase L1-like esterase